MKSFKKNFFDDPWEIAWRGVHLRLSSIHWKKMNILRRNQELIMMRDRTVGCITLYTK